MKISKPQLSVLTALYRLGQSDLPVNVTTVAVVAAKRRGAVACHLSALDDLGLVDACRLRLTLAGLALAVAHVAPARVQVENVALSFDSLAA
jgi:hypothetical protein